VIIQKRFAGKANYPVTLLSLCYLHRPIAGWGGEGGEELMETLTEEWV